MQQYLDLCKTIIEKGEFREDRTGTGTKSYFGYQMRFDLQAGFPLLTTKKVHFRSVIEELLWFLSGSTNIRPLVLKNVRIWNEWPYQRYQQSSDYNGESIDQFIEKIKEDVDFADKYGDLGPVYGKQWRDFFGVDQITELIKNLKENPFSRRHLVVAFNPAEIKEMALPPCHAFFQFYVSSDKKRISCQLYQRSADVFLGVPFNIASYAFLVYMIAEVTGYEVGEFIHTIGDAHIYNDHLKQVELQLTRKPRKIPQLRFKRKVNNIFDFTFDDFQIIDYDPEPAIKAKISV